MGWGVTDESTTFERRISPDLAYRLGHEAVDIIEAGHYAAADGRVVDIEARLAASVDGCVAYPPGTEPVKPTASGGPSSIEVRNETTLSAARRQLRAGFNPVVLNFASALEPGGGFLRGARAQEEYLARSTGLYACLKDQEMYAYHRRQNDPLHSDYVLYAPRVPVFRDDDHALLAEPWTVGVLTSAAPTVHGLLSCRRDGLRGVFEARVRKVLATGLAHGHDAIVLGAWGCGAFGNDAVMVADVFRQALSTTFQGAYRGVIFAIVDESAEKRFIGPFDAAFAV